MPSSDILQEGIFENRDDVARYSRRMQFQAGPNQHTFYACQKHLAELEEGHFNGLFDPIRGQNIEPVDPDDAIPCDLCREG